MNWVVLPGALPGGLVELSVGVGAALVALLVACAPAVLAVRHTLRRRKAQPHPQLHVYAGGKEIRRDAA